ncbi:hypothetical protein HELRODRAFT_185670 [Helobdella robusta]|uniref:RRM domain-containing protein n=1 Tax=Helobdella robusta TaxID=6412 RepID=T1FN44_HELRO|nr:hypothetical protein HELRODRAFT_185670 [Helobdella robusta]ESO03182.1 hypothetical protein HELRODRAFT_185670 [Helobdella robusta]
MASNKIDMSLDDIIKLNKPQMKTGRRNVSQQQQPRRFNNQQFASGGYNDNRQNRNFGVSRGRVTKTSPRYNNRQSNNSSDSTWVHDKFDDFKPNVLPPVPVQRPTSTIIRISNLNYTVSDQDIKELFGEFGSMIRSSLNYDRSGRSLGSAEVEYSNREAAMKACEQYNKVPLDGLPMEIAFVRNSNPQDMGSRLGAKKNVEPYSRNNFSVRGRFQNNNNNRGSRPNQQRPRPQQQQGQRVKKEDLTKEQLDADLDDYLNKMDH